MVLSPCINVCTLEDGVCTACNRTIEDITRWGAMTDAERKRRMAELDDHVDSPSQSHDAPEPEDSQRQ